MELIDVHPAEVQPGDYMCINDELIKIIKVYPDRVIIDFDGGERFVEDDWYKIGVRYKRKVGEHLHGIIPDEFGAVIRVNGRIYVKSYSGWLQPQADTFNTRDEMQQLADLYGFEVLWPKPAIKITDEMIDRAARALSYEMTVEKWDDLTTWEINRFLKGAMVALEAALGEQE